MSGHDELAPPTGIDEAEVLICCGGGGLTSGISLALASQAPGLTPRPVEPQGFEPYLEMGVKHFNVGMDVTTLFKWLRKSGDIMRRELGAEPLGPSTETKRSSYAR